MSYMFFEFWKHCAREIYLIIYSLGDVGSEGLKRAYKGHFDQCHGTSYRLLELKQKQVNFITISLEYNKWGCHQYPNKREVYVISHKSNADINTLNYVQKVGLKNKEFTRMIEHMSHTIKLLSVSNWSIY